jgi:hypothetical protein
MKNIFQLSLFIIVLSLSACSSGNKKTEKDPNAMVTNTATVPAAHGKVDTDVDKNGNTNLRIAVEHLAEPDMIAQGANGYVVWVQPQGTNTYQNIGTLKVNENLEGTYNTSVPYKKFNILITPEANTQAQSPSGIAVFERNVSL